MNGGENYMKLIFSGDIMLDSEIIEKHQTNAGNYNFSSIFSDIKGFLETGDFVVGNLETPITKNHSKIRYEKYRFTSPIDFAKAVKESGFNCVSTANNHCLDNGIQGIQETIECLNEVGLKHTGVSLNKEKILIENIGDAKIAILSYTYGTNAFSNNVYLSKKDTKTIKINMFQNQELSNKLIRKIYKGNSMICKISRKIIRKLKLLQLNKPIYERVENSYRQKREIKRKIKYCRNAGANYIIMCMHEGGQYNLEPLRKTEKIVKFLKNNGIGLIIGNHEHVIQKIKMMDKQLVAYSLGNFVSTAGVLKEPFDRMAEYSILLNIYLENKNNSLEIEKCTFTILKTVVDTKTKSIKVKLLYDLVNECKGQVERERLIKDNQKIIHVITNKEVIQENVLMENVLFTK